MRIFPHELVGIFRRLFWGFLLDKTQRIEEWGEWMRETLLLDVPHRQIVFTIPKRLRVF